MSTAILEMIETGDMDALHNKWFVVNGKWARAGNIGICNHMNLYSFVGSTYVCACVRVCGRMHVPTCLFGCSKFYISLCVSVSSVTAKRGCHSGGKCACPCPYSNRESHITRHVTIANQLTITIWQRDF